MIALLAHTEMTMAPRQGLTTSILPLLAIVSVLSSLSILHEFSESKGLVASNHYAAPRLSKAHYSTLS